MSKEPGAGGLLLHLAPDGSEVIRLACRHAPIKHTICPAILTRPEP